MTTTGSSNSQRVLTKFVHPFIVIRDAIKKRFVLVKRKNKLDHRVVRKVPKPRPEGTVLLTTSEKKYRHCKGSQNLWYECEDRLCNKYWLNDASGEKVTKNPKAATIIQLMFPKDDQMFEKRVLYLRTRPNSEYATEVRQLLILSENESIQRIRTEATNIGARQLEHAEIHTLDDLLNLVGILDWREKFEAEGIDLSTAFFLKDQDLLELGLSLGERIRLTQVLECMRKIEVVRRGGENTAAVIRTTKFIKGDTVEHLKESENLIRRGKVVGVHADDIAAGVYYTVALENEGGYEVQSAERKLEFPGIWENVLREKGIEPIFKEPGGDDDNAPYQAMDAMIEEHYEEEAAQEELAEEYAVEHEEPGVEYEEEGGEEEAEYTGRAPPPLPPTSQEVAGEEEEIESSSAVHAEEMPMYVGMSRYSRRQSVAPLGASAGEFEGEDDHDRKTSVVSLLPMVDAEQLMEGDDKDESSGMMVPPPAIPATRRRSSAASKASTSASHRESVFSLLPTTEIMELDEDENETSGMLAPPPPIPHRSDSVSTEEEALEELSTHSVVSYHEPQGDIEDEEHSGMPPPPLVPSSRRSSAAGSRKNSIARVDSSSRRVSFSSVTAHSPSHLVNARRPSSNASLNDTSSVRMEEELSAMGEVEPLEMHEEVIDLDDEIT